MKAKIIKHPFCNAYDETEFVYYAKYKKFLFWHYIRKSENHIPWGERHILAPKAEYHTKSAAASALEDIYKRHIFKKSQKDEVINIRF